MILPGIFWFIFGCILLNIIVILVYRTDIVHNAREKNGTMKNKMPLRGILTIGFFLFFVCIYFIVFNFVFFQKLSEFNFLYIFLANLVLITLLSFYDAFIIDLIVLGVWKPSFLQIPEEVTIQSMKKHVIIQLTIGWIIKIPIAAFSTLIFWILNL